MNIKKVVVTALMSVTLLGPCATTVSAAPYKSYAYWFKKDNYRYKPRSVVLTKNIKIRKIVWTRNSIQNHLGKAKILKKGSKVKVIANNPKYCWAFFGKYKNWVYPYKKANWFVPSKKIKSKKNSSKFNLELKNGTYFIKNQGELKLNSATTNGTQIVISGSFKNTSKSEINIAELINQYLKITITGSDQVVKLSESSTVGSHQNGSFELVGTVDHPEAIESGKALTIVSNVLNANAKIVYLPYRK